MRCFLLFFLLAGPLCLAQSAKPQKDYLQAHHASWDGSFSRLQRVFDKSFYSQQVFLIGETHGIQYSYELQIALIRQLKHKTNFRYLLLEVGYLDGLLLNRYLRSGNEGYLEQFFKAQQGNFHWNKSTEKLYKNLYALNRALPDNEQIILLPLDLAFAHRESLLWLQDSVFTPLQRAGSFEEALYALDPREDTASELLLKYLLAYERFTAQEALYRQQLGPAYAETAYLLRNLYQRYQLQRSGSMDQQRDSIMYENLLFWKKQYGIGQEKMVGLFGSEHVKQVQQADQPRLGAILKASEEVAGLVSLYMVYTNCEIMLPNRMASQDTGMPVYLTRKLVNDGSMCEPTAGLELLKPFEQASKASLFNLAGRHSPFAQSGAFLKQSEQQHSTTDMFQILILINSSPATLPYRNTTHPYSGLSEAH
jgi:hypothetical protein